MIRKIDHINISVTNLEESTKFFTEILNFEKIKEDFLEGDAIEKVTGLSDVKAKFVALKIPGTETNLELIQYFNPKGTKDPQTGKSNQIGFRHMALEVSDIESVVEKLKATGVKLFSGIQPYGKNKKLIYFLGPDDIILELAEYGQF